MQESEFHRRADHALDALEETLEALERDGLECDRVENALTITLPSGRQIVLNKHTPTQELWLASPVSGGLHFSWMEGRGWMLKDGRSLADTLKNDLQKLMSLTVSFPDLVAD